MTNPNEHLSSRQEPGRFHLPSEDELRGSRSSSRPELTRTDGGIPDKIYVPYRALAMGLFAIALVLGMFAVLKLTSNPESDIQKLQDSEGRSTATNTESAAAPRREQKSSGSAEKSNGSQKKPDVLVCVFNAGSTPRLGAKIVNVLKDAGFPVNPNASNYKDPSIKKTTVYYPENHQDEGERVSKQLDRQASVLQRPSSLSVCPNHVVVIMY